jgi:hypothetical protein
VDDGTGRVEEVESTAVDPRAVVGVAETVVETTAPLTSMSRVVVDAEEVAVLVSSGLDFVVVLSVLSGFFDFVLVVVFVVAAVGVSVVEVSFVIDALAVVEDLEDVLVEVDVELGGG